MHEPVMAQMLFQAFILMFFSSNVVLSQNIIKTLPGYAGNLPFKLETGYIGVGDLDDVQLFYYFVESQNSPKDDPLLLWLTGGPGCSGLTGLVYEIGPLSFDYTNCSGNKAVLSLNPYSWTKVANIIFLDQPVGTGFSYAKSGESYNVDDTISAKQTYTFLRKWFMTHPKFLTNSFYVTGDSYGGKIGPIVADEISNGNDVGHAPPIYLKGYAFGNPVTYENKDINSRVEFAYLKNLIPDGLYESTKRNCKGQYVDVDPNNALCMIDIQHIEECVEKLMIAQILEPDCSSYLSPRPMKKNSDPRALMEDAKYFLLSRSQNHGLWCRMDNYVWSYIWANDKTVQEALHIREGTKTEWVRCNESLSYTKNIPSVVEYHRELIKKGYTILIYSGDHDMAIPYVGTKAWINSLNMTVSYDWGPWFVDGQIAGYTIQYYYASMSTVFTFATVKGGGHTAPEYKPKESFEMIRRWLVNYPL